MKEIKKLNHLKINTLLVFLLFPLFGSGVGGEISARSIIDMAGRRVSIPNRITRVLPYDNKTNVILFSVASDLMIAKARSMESPHLRLISKEFLGKREIDTKNAEEVIKAKPEILIVAAFVEDRDDISKYESFAAKVHIPLIVIDLELMNLNKTYTFLGQLLGKTVEARRCSDYIQSVYSDMNRLVKSRRVYGKAYMANGATGLRTSPQSSLHNQLFEVMNVPNAAHVTLDAKGFANVSMEQVLAWNPDYIFCVGKGEGSPYRNILKSATWHNVSAVKKHYVFFIPTEPYSWFDIPPSVNRILGIVWFSHIFYGQSAETTKQRVKDFYRIFYRYNLTEKEYVGLYKWQ